MDESVAKERITRITPLLEKIYDEENAERKGKEQPGYVMEVKEKTIIIRPEMHAPEVDEYDEVALKNIKTGKIEIGEKVQYIF